MYIADVGWIAILALVALGIYFWRVTILILDWVMCTELLWGTAFVADKMIRYTRAQIKADEIELSVVEKAINLSLIVAAALIISFLVLLLYYAARVELHKRFKRIPEFMEVIEL